MNVKAAIKVLENTVLNPKKGLPDDIFYYISKTTPLVNVDLLIKDERQRTLLAWRDDPCAGLGWHIPGGIIRFKETFYDRVQKVAQLEVGIDCIEYDPAPLAVNQIILKETDKRGHFISILYRCFLTGDFSPNNRDLNPDDPGYRQWHERCPDNLLKFHEIYREFI